jgi:hypothetical protein
MHIYHSLDQIETSPDHPNSVCDPGSLFQKPNSIRLGKIKSIPVTFEGWIHELLDLSQNYEFHCGKYKKYHIHQLRNPAIK